MNGNYTIYEQLYAQLQLAGEPGWGGQQRLDKEGLNTITVPSMFLNPARLTQKRGFEMDLSCHCGRIKLQVEAPPARLTSCNCSVCHRYGALWGNYMPEQVQVEANAEHLQAYSWSDKYVAFIHCTHCGCPTHYLTTEKTEDATVGVNFRMAERTAISAIPVRYFDGADTWQFLDGPEK